MKYDFQKQPYSIQKNPDVHIDSGGSVVIKNDIKHTPNLRPCVVKLEEDKNDFEVNAYFHGWFSRSKSVDPSLLNGWYIDGIINYVVGIIEYEDGTIDECKPENIRFTDRG